MGQAELTRGLVLARGAWRHHRVRLPFLGRLVSKFGDWLTQLALPGSTLLADHHRRARSRNGLSFTVWPSTLIHTVAGLAPVFSGLAGEVLPAGTRVVHLVDEELLQDTIRAGQIRPETRDRVRA